MPHFITQTIASINDVDIENLASNSPVSISKVFVVLHHSDLSLTENPPFTIGGEPIVQFGAPTSNAPYEIKRVSKNQTVIKKNRDQNQGDNVLIIFSKPASANWHQTAYQDHITEAVILTRADNKGLFNIATETQFDKDTFTSPVDTEWAYPANNHGNPCNIGTAADLIYATWNQAVNGDPPSVIGIPGICHLISDDLYFEITVSSWGIGNTGGEVSYSRTVPTTVVRNEITFYNPPTSFAFDSTQEALYPDTAPYTGKDVQITVVTTHDTLCLHKTVWTIEHMDTNGNIAWTDTGEDYSDYFFLNASVDEAYPTANINAICMYQQDSTDQNYTTNYDSYGYYLDLFNVPMEVVSYTTGDWKDVVYNNRAPYIIGFNQPVESGSLNGNVTVSSALGNIPVNVAIGSESHLISVTPQVGYSWDTSEGAVNTITMTNITGQSGNQLNTPVETTFTAPGTFTLSTSLFTPEGIFINQAFILDIGGNVDLFGISSYPTAIDCTVDGLTVPAYVSLINATSDYEVRNGSATISSGFMISFQTPYWPQGLLSVNLDFINNEFVVGGKYATGVNGESNISLSIQVDYCIPSITFGDLLGEFDSPINPTYKNYSIPFTVNAGRASYNIVEEIQTTYADSSTDFTSGIVYYADMWYGNVDVNAVRRDVTLKLMYDPMLVGDYSTVATQFSFVELWDYVAPPTYLPFDTGVVKISVNPTDNNPEIQQPYTIDMFNRPNLELFTPGLYQVAGTAIHQISIGNWQRIITHNIGVLSEYTEVDRTFDWNSLNNRAVHVGNAWVMDPNMQPPNGTSLVTCAVFTPQSWVYSRAVSSIRLTTAFTLTIMLRVDYTDGTSSDTPQVHYTSECIVNTDPTKVISRLYVYYVGGMTCNIFVTEATASNLVTADYISHSSLAVFDFADIETANFNTTGYDYTSVKVLFFGTAGICQLFALDNSILDISSLNHYFVDAADSIDYNIGLHWTMTSNMTPMTAEILNSVDEVIFSESISGSSIVVNNWNILSEQVITDYKLRVSSGSIVRLLPVAFTAPTRISTGSWVDMETFWGQYYDIENFGNKTGTEWTSTPTSGPHGSQGPDVVGMRLVNPTGQYSGLKMSQIRVTYTGASNLSLEVNYSGTIFNIPNETAVDISSNNMVDYAPLKFTGDTGSMFTITKIEFIFTIGASWIDATNNCIELTYANNMTKFVIDPSDSFWSTKNIEAFELVLTPSEPLIKTILATEYDAYSYPLFTFDNVTNIVSSMMVKGYGDTTVNGHKVLDGDNFHTMEIYPETNRVKTEMTQWMWDYTGKQLQFTSPHIFCRDAAGQAVINSIYYINADIGGTYVVNNEYAPTNINFNTMYFFGHINRLRILCTV